MGKLEKEIKALVAELKKTKRKRGKKKAKKKQGKKKTLAEYARDKMLLDAYQKSLSGGGGGGVATMSRPIATANLDTERVKSELADLKEKVKEEKKKAGDELKRLESGLDQYKKQLTLEFEDRPMPRMGFVGRDGDMFSADDMEEMYNHVQEQISTLNRQMDKVKSQKQEAIGDDDTEKVKELSVQEDTLLKRARQLDEKRKLYNERRRMKRQQERFERLMREEEERSQREAQVQLRADRAKAREAKTEVEEDTPVVEKKKRVRQPKLAPAVEEDDE